MFCIILRRAGPFVICQVCYENCHGQKGARMHAAFTVLAEGRVELEVMCAAPGACLIGLARP